MRVIKRNESEQDFCLDKIEKAIRKANSTVAENEKMNDEAVQKVIATVQKKLAGFNSVKVEDIQDFVEQALVRHNKYAVAKSYIIYRDSKKQNKKFTENEEKIISLIDGTSSLRGDNANKHIDDNASIRDYIAGIMCKSLANKTLPKDIIKAHNNGVIHWHDADYSPTQPLINCDVYNLEDMFNNGFVMGDTKIEPNSETPFRTIVNLAAQSALLISGRQYGGQTMTWIHLVPYVDQTRKIIRKNIIDDFNNIGVSVSDGTIDELTEKKVRDEIAEGVKIYQYQILCHSSANGQTPFVSNNLCLREAMTQRELDDFAMIIEEILKRRIKGVKDSSGKYITPLFPKLLYWTCDGLNVKKGDPYFYLTELAAKCIATRIQPDIVSESQTRKHKQGQIIPCMGCVDKDEIVTYRFNGVTNTARIKDMWTELSRHFEVKNQVADDCYYIDLKGVEIYDSTSKKGFVKCLRMNKNADQGDWKLVKISNGRLLTCTSDHPLAVVGKGRTEVKDLNVGDEIEATNKAYSVDEFGYDNDVAEYFGEHSCVLDETIYNNVIHSTKENRLAYLKGLCKENNGDIFVTSKSTANFIVYLANTVGWDAEISLVDIQGTPPYHITMKVNGEGVEESKHYVVEEIIDLGNRNEYSYDVTTSTDRFDVSGIQSHNCRSLLGPIWEERTYPIETEFFWTEGSTYPYDKFVDKRTFESLPDGEYQTGYENGQYCINFRGNTGWLIKKTSTEVVIKQPIVYGRWNNGVITINLPYVALEAKENGIDFYENLDKWLDLCRKAMQERVKSCRKIKAKNSPILWMHGALARMSPEETVGELMDKYPTRPTVSLGYVGLYETVQALIGESNTTDNGRKLSKEIMQYMNDKLLQWNLEGEFDEKDIEIINDDEDFDLDD